MMRARIERNTALPCSTPRGRLLLAFVAAVALSACDACDDKPPAGAQRAQLDASVLDLAPEPTEAELTEVWADAARDIAVGKSDAFPLRYSIPTCSVRYELRSVILGEVAEGRPPAGIETRAEVVGNPDTARLTWQVVNVRTFLLHDGERLERPNSDGDWAPALVHTDGKVWFEERGPTTLWTAFSAVPPLSAQFPALREANEIGVAYPWIIETYPRATTAKIEERRTSSPDASVPNVAPDRTEAKVHVAERVSLTYRHGDAPRSIRAAVLHGAWTIETTETHPTETQRAERWKGRWVVTEHGRLLHAISLAGKYQWWSRSKTEQTSKAGSSEIELRLVEDCDGPTLPPASSSKEN